MPTPKDLFAYWDTFAGLVPCRVFEASRETVSIRLTASRGPYKRGEIHELQPRHVWPRDVARPKPGTYGNTWIVGPYNWRQRFERPR